MAMEIADRSESEPGPPDQGILGQAAAESAAASELAMTYPASFPLEHPWAGRTLELALKRTMDIVGSLVGLALSAPLLLLAAVAIKLDSPGPVLYRQKRVGRGNKEFTIYKLRTMVQDAEKDGPKWAERDDGRVTPVGRLLRLTRIDELPQFWNVLIGEMSLVGPRPERKCFVREFVKEDPRFAWRTMVKPGITGWAQVNGGYDLKPVEKLAYDLEYIQGFSLGLELKIILRTIGVIFRGDGAR
ncbi:MAG: exopolysaccharide biosynthesis polyprenyl glycosylphosphotransferase [Bacteroidota bacterium]